MHQSPGEATKMVKDGAQDMWGDAERDVCVQPGDEKAKGNLTAVYNSPMGGCKEDGAILFADVPRDRVRDKKQKFLQVKFQLDTGKKNHWAGHQTLDQGMKRLWDLHPWRYLSIDWTKPCATQLVLVQAGSGPQEVPSYLNYFVFMWFCLDCCGFH